MITAAGRSLPFPRTGDGRYPWQKWLPAVAGMAIMLVATVLGAAPLLSTHAAEQRCERVPVMLWGDGKHDDTPALNAWLRGQEAVWADTGQPVGATIRGRAFRLSEAVYVRAGTGRALHDFRMEWPERGEIVTGGSVHAGADPDGEPLLSGVSIVGGDPGEGVPFDMPEPAASERGSEAGCATS